MRHSFFIPILLLLDALFLILASSSLSISRYEAAIFFEGQGYLTHILNASVSLFGQNDFSLRIPFIGLHILNVYMLYLVSRDIVKKEGDVFLVLLIFVLLPGVNTAALIVSKTGIVIFLTLLFVRLYQVHGKHAYYLLPLVAFLDNAFLYLAVSLIFYGHYRKDNRLLFFAILAFAISYYVFGLDFGKEAQGYFLDIFSIYAAVFSPLIFLFFIYGLYWQFVKAKTRLPILWFISAVVFLISIILSLRQNVRIEDFAPYAVIFVPYMVYAFFNSYRIRLPEFRRNHKAVFSVVMLTLILNTVVTFFNKPLYLLLDNPRKHFAYEQHFTKELVAALKAKGIAAVHTESRPLENKLRFYGIMAGGDYTLLTVKPERGTYERIDLEVLGKVIETYYLIKG